MRILMALAALAMAGTAAANPLDSYWENLQALCGKAFEGQLITHPEGEYLKGLLLQRI